MYQSSISKATRYGLGIIITLMIACHGYPCPEYPHELYQSCGCCPKYISFLTRISKLGIDTIAFNAISRCVRTELSHDKNSFISNAGLCLANVQVVDEFSRQKIILELDRAFEDSQKADKEMSDWLQCYRTYAKVDYIENLEKQLASAKVSLQEEKANVRQKQEALEKLQKAYSESQKQWSRAGSANTDKMVAFQLAVDAKRKRQAPADEILELEKQLSVFKREDRVLKERIKIYESDLGITCTIAAIQIGIKYVLKVAESCKGRIDQSKLSKESTPNA